MYSMQEMLDEFENKWKQHIIKQNTVVDVGFDIAGKQGTIYHLLISKYYNGTYFATDLIKGKTINQANSIEMLGHNVGETNRPIFYGIEADGKELQADYPPELISQMKKAMGKDPHKYSNKDFIGFWKKFNMQPGHVALVETNKKIHQLFLSQHNMFNWYATDLETGETISYAHDQEGLATGIAYRLDSPRLIAEIKDPIVEDRHGYVI